MMKEENEEQRKEEQRRGKLLFTGTSNLWVILCQTRREVRYMKRLE